jgi:hypothetical protein
MFFYTDTADAPWTVIKSDDKKRARLNCMRISCRRWTTRTRICAGGQAPDPLIVGRRAM